MWAPTGTLVMVPTRTADGLPTIAVFRYNHDGTRSYVLESPHKAWVEAYVARSNGRLRQFARV